MQTYSDHDMNRYPTQVFNARKTAIDRSTLYMLNDLVDNLTTPLGKNFLENLAICDGEFERLVLFLADKLIDFSNKRWRTVQFFELAHERAVVIDYVSKTSQRHRLKGTLLIELVKRVKNAGLLDRNAISETQSGYKHIISAVDRPTVPENVAFIFMLHELESEIGDAILEVSRHYERFQEMTSVR